jgi:division protein CdvB (Snf7/Vps24/ESCRT-III family)
VPGGDPKQCSKAVAKIAEEISIALAEVDHRIYDALVESKIIGVPAAMTPASVARQSYSVRGSMSSRRL